MFITRPTTGTVVISWIQTYIGELQYCLARHFIPERFTQHWNIWTVTKKIVDDQHCSMERKQSVPIFTILDTERMALEVTFENTAFRSSGNRETNILGRTKGNYMRSKKGKKEGYSGRLGKVYTCTGRHSWSCNSITNQHSCWACKESQ